jgi:phosphoribosylformimino-5-aminoimidazole carboxamide ribotide isomerase
MLVIPSIDLQGGRSRLVSWPGAATGQGAPSDRPEVIAERFVHLGAKVVHLVDFDGATAGMPVNLEAIGRIASRIAVPIQVAGGLEAPDHIRLAFAAGATRVVLAMNVADDPDMLQACLDVAGDWLAIGLDPRPERLAEYPWRTSRPPSLGAPVTRLVGDGVRRFVLGHGGAQPDTVLLRSLSAAHDAEILVAGGVRDVAGLAQLRDAGVSGVILGEPLLSGEIDYSAALEAAA